MRYVVIGAGPAGVTAVETLRKQDSRAELILIGEEPEPAYSRMAIPYYLAGKIQEQGTYLRHDPDHLDRLGVRQIRQRVTAVDSATRQVKLANGETVSFDRLLLATGSDPVKPPIDGLDQPGVHHCWTLEDARNIAQYAQPGSRVVLMGAGFIGCIIMEALAERGVDLTVVEMGDRMVPRMMDQESGNLIKQWCLKQGVKVHTSTRVTGVQANSNGNARFTLQCDPVDPIDADLVVVATGVKPAVDYLRDSGIELGQGVVVNQQMESSVPGIYAAGDSCEGIDWGSGGKHAVHAIQPVAAETARIAALNMCGQVTPYAGSMAMNVLDTLGLISVSYGQWMGVPGGDHVHRMDSAEYRYIRLQFSEDRLVGAITLGMTQHVGVLRGLIQSRVRLGKWKQHLMEDPTRIMEAYLGATQLTQG
ncbi:NAD(P)/FAD-dependent oxidoreductase [Sedimenticola thiotaurini]|uniref:Pyridine nucleotide-disulfide oxidoreductase n=1 Tax=Sedimenticola thiotaurini TaxID=1543721 RepID=A0A0F7JWT7_9GAMM|nr:FAD-dependent oxidoreductase [Sedimenticola thiotaurini]AKH20062.1 pyridine nucleotide-disulfide oxidoreductase [Sedimenticola thiotaurini]